VRSCALSLVFTVVVAAVTFFHFHGGFFCDLQRDRGANIDHAVGLSFAVGLAGSLLLLFTRRRPRLRRAVLLTAGTLLGIAVVLVALDSATYTGHRSCGLFTGTNTTINERVYYLYVFWGMPAALLLFTAVSELRPVPVDLASFVPVGLLIGTVVLGTWALAASGSRNGSGSRKRSKLPAGTKVFAEPNHDHVAGKVRYNRTPPAGGPHNDVWLNCGVYTRPVRNENADHSLEHGAVWITYAPDLTHANIARLRHFVESHYHGSERYLILSPYPGLKRPVVVSAWGAQLELRGAADPRLAAFVAHFAGGDQGGEPGGYCTGGIGSPSG